MTRTLPQSLQAVMAIVSEYFGLGPAELVSADRSVRTSRPRMIAFLLAREFTRHSTTAIGVAFCRDHTSVVHGLRRIQDLAHDQPEIAEALDALRPICAMELTAATGARQQASVRSKARLLLERLSSGVAPTDDPVQLLIAVGRAAEQLAAPPQATTIAPVKPRSPHGRVGESDWATSSRISAERLEEMNAAHLAQVRIAGDYARGAHA